LSSQPFKANTTSPQLPEIYIYRTAILQRTPTFSGLSLQCAERTTLSRRYRSRMAAAGGMAAARTAGHSTATWLSASTMPAPAQM
jgi:hypothetical protein